MTQQYLRYRAGIAKKTSAMILTMAHNYCQSAANASSTGAGYFRMEMETT